MQSSRSMPPPVFVSVCHAPGGIGIASPAETSPLSPSSSSTPPPSRMKYTSSLSRVVVAVRRLAGLERRLGDAVPDGAAGRDAAELADQAPVLRHERLRRSERADVDHSACASASITRSCASASMPEWNGIETSRRLASSETGHIPSRKPNRSRMYDWRWIDGR